MGTIISILMKRRANIKFNVKAEKNDPVVLWLVRLCFTSFLFHF